MATASSRGCLSSGGLHDAPVVLPCTEGVLALLGGLQSQLWPLCLSKGCANSATCRAKAAAAISCWQQKVGGSEGQSWVQSLCVRRAVTPTGGLTGVAGWVHLQGSGAGGEEQVEVGVVRKRSTICSFPCCACSAPAPGLCCLHSFLLPWLLSSPLSALASFHAVWGHVCPKELNRKPRS